MMEYFFAFAAIIASLPLILTSGAVVWSLLGDLIDGAKMYKDDRDYALATLALWVVIGYADYHALQLLFGGAA